MKKSIFLLFAGVAVFALGFLSSCNPKPEDVVKKIQEGKELSQKDYQVIADYACEGLLAMGDSIETYKDMPERIPMAMIELARKYPYSDLMLYALETADTASFSPDTKKAVEKMYGLIDSNRDLLITLKVPGVIDVMQANQEEAQDSVAADSVFVPQGETGVKLGE